MQLAAIWHWYLSLHVYVCVCVCNILLYIFVFAEYLLVSYMCANESEFGHVWLLATGLFTEIPVCKFLCGWRAYSPKPLFYYFISCPLYVFIHFSAAFCTAHCALDLAKDHAP